MYAARRFRPSDKAVALKMTKLLRKADACERAAYPRCCVIAWEALCKDLSEVGVRQPVSQKYAQALLKLASKHYREDMATLTTILSLWRSGDTENEEKFNLTLPKLS